MSEVRVIGMDLAKNTFQLHGVDVKGKTVLRKKLRREQVVNFFANLPDCLVGMEACSSSAYWARVIESCGHTVRRIHAKFVKPYLVGPEKRVSGVRRRLGERFRSLPRPTGRTG